jgi:Zn-finger protein
MHDASEKGGEWIKTRGTRRWQCATCCANKKPPMRKVTKERSDDSAILAKATHGR